MDQEKIGRFIASCRKELNLTQEQVAEKLGVSNKTVSRWENGNGFPDVSLLQPLCELLNISVNELLVGEKIPEDNYRKKVEESTIRILEETCHILENSQHFANGKNPTKRKHLFKNKEPIDLTAFGTAAIVFIILKLTGTLTWSWLWVLSPLWIGFALSLIIVAAALIIMRKKFGLKHIWKMPGFSFRFKFF